MADLSDVDATLRGILASAIYPSGTSSPSAVLNGATPVPVGIVSGWPVDKQLRTDLAAGQQTVSIFANMPDRNTTRYPTEWKYLSAQSSPTITAAVAASGSTVTVTLAGTITLPENVGAIVAGVGYVYGVQTNDTLTTIAAALAALINVNTPATSSGPVITITTTRPVTARVGGVATTWRELRRQEQPFMITCWCGSPELRVALAKFVDGVMTGIGSTIARDRITLPDGTSGRLRYMRTNVSDQGELAQLYRRDLYYSVDYATTEISSAATIVLIKQTETQGVAAVAPTPSNPSGNVIIAPVLTLYT